MEAKVVNDWRLRGQRYRLEGEVCDHCGETIFPPRDICPACSKPAKTSHTLSGKGEVVLIYPKTAAFDRPLPVFEFLHSAGLNLWVLPFCLKSRRLEVPHGEPFVDSFTGTVVTGAI